MDTPPPIPLFTSESDIGTIPALPSEQIRSAVGSLGSVNNGPDDPQEALNNVTHHNLTLSHARSVVSVARQYAAVRQAQERHHFMTLGPTRNLSAQAAFDVALLARNTLVAEAELALTRFKEREILLITLQDACEQASRYVAAAERQVHHFISHLDPGKLSNVSLDFEYPFYWPIPPAVIFSYRDHIRSFLPIDWHAGKNNLASLSDLSTDDSEVASEGSVVLAEDTFPTTSPLSLQSSRPPGLSRPFLNSL